MKNSSKRLLTLAKILIFSLVLISCEEEKPVQVIDGVTLPDNYGILEIDFKLPAYPSIQKGIRRLDLATCYSMAEMYRGIFFYHANVSDVKQVYQIFLPEGTFFYQAAITCTCAADSCITGGFPYGYGGMKFAFDKVDIVKGKITRSQPSFQ
jgi:hypothetical protein